MQTILIVGEKFAEFARLGHVQCVNDFEALLVNPAATFADVEFTLGQGVSPERVSRLLGLAAARGVRHQLLFEETAKCGRRHVHKERLQNSVISLPQRTAEHRFEAELFLDDDCELLSDHVAGKHLQGMVLIEAARQMCLAVSEEFFAGRYPNGAAFLWTAITVRFLGYAFPSRVFLRYHVLEHSQKQAKADAFKVEIEFVQAGNVVAASDIDFETRDKAAVERRESKLASAAAGAPAAVG